MGARDKKSCFLSHKNAPVWRVFGPHNLKQRDVESGPVNRAGLGNIVAMLRLSPAGHAQKGFLSPSDRPSSEGRTHESSFVL